MHLLQAWKDSLSLFKPKSFKLFVLVTAKSIVQAYWFLFKYFWWIPLGTISASFYFNHHYAWGIGFSAWLFVTVLCVRPSVSKKNYAYFRSYGTHVPSFVMGLVIFGWPLLAVVSSWRAKGTVAMIALNYGMVFVASIVILLFYFFLFDMPASINNWVKAARCAYRMFSYNLPAIGLLCMPLILVTGFMGLRVPEAIHFLSWIVIPLQACILNNFYIKRLHEQPQLFFKRPKE